MGTADDAIAVSTILMNTFLAGAGGVMAAATVTRLAFGKTDVIQMLNAVSYTHLTLPTIVSV